MDATKPYEFIGFGAMDATKPYEFIGFGATDATQTAQAEGPGNLWSVFGPFALSLRPTPPQNLPREPGPGTGSAIVLIVWSH